MKCTRPIYGFRSKVLNPTAKRGVVFTERDGLTHATLTLPCGKCLGCRMEYARQWAVRCDHELRLHEVSSFLTLTYDEEFVPYSPSGLQTLVIEDTQKFWKRLRLEVGKLRYFMCGEYGSKTLRPHYHALVFGWSPGDRLFYGDSKGGAPMYTSRLLDQVWGLGRCTVQDADWNTANYVARYVTKKQVDRDDGSDDRRPEFLTMSRRPGIGSAFASEYLEGWFSQGFLVSNGHRMKPPRYYENLAKGYSKVLLQEAKRKRAEVGAEMEFKRVAGSEVSHHSVEVVRESKLRTLSRDGVD